MNLIAQNPIGNVTPPNQISSISTGTGAEALGRFITLIANLVISVSAIIFLFMIIFAGVQWITSGGNKEKVAAARSKITHAAIGLTIVMLAAALSRAFGQIFGYQLFGP